MHESLIAYIKNRSITPLSRMEIEVIKDVFVPKKLKKHQYLLQEGEVCKYSAFIVKGAVRQFKVDDRGVEHVVRLCIENWWTVDRESWVRQTPSEYNIEAMEDSTLLLMTLADYWSRLHIIPAVNETTKKMDENYAIAIQKKVSSIGLSAEERYAQLIKTNPDFLQRFPQHIIASYLGIAKETLSRLRGHAIKK